MRPDIQLSTGFHCARVKAPSVQDLGKLIWLLGYLSRIRFIPLIIEIDDEGNVYIYIDQAHIVHADRKGHSGLYIIIGKGAMLNMSKKLGVIIASSTETEIVSIGERFPKCT